MQCYYCQAPLNVHIMQPSQGQQVMYCENCHRYQPRDTHLRCRACGLSFERFQKTGQLGCQHCYTSFADELQPLIRAYQQKQGPHKPIQLSYQPESLARARTAEALAFINNTAKALQSDALHDVTVPSPLTHHKEFSVRGTTPGAIGLRIRMARNLDGLVYERNLSDEHRRRLDIWLFSEGSSLVNLFKQAGYKHAVLANDDLPDGARAGIGQSNGFLAYSGDEDHLRVVYQTFWSELPRKDDQPFMAGLLPVLTFFEQVDRLFACQFHSRHGFLTACPGLGGLGLRISLQLDLRASSRSRHWPALHSAIEQAGFELRTARPQNVGTTRYEISLRHHGLELRALQGLERVLGMARRMHAREQSLRNSF